MCVYVIVCVCGGGGVHIIGAREMIIFFFTIVLDLVDGTLKLFYL